MKAEADSIVAAARFLAERGWAPAGAGNYSHRLSDGSIAVTVSGGHKAALTADDVMRIDERGRPLDGRKPSAEAALHLAVYRQRPKTKAVLHTHSIPAVALSIALARQRNLQLKGYELQKAFPGVTTHLRAIELPILDNIQDMHVLANQVASVLTGGRPPVFLIRGHGLYGWGDSMEEALCVVEAAETMIACELELLRLNRRS